MTLFFFAGGGGSPFVGARLALAPQFRVTSSEVVFSRGGPGTGFAQPDARWTTDLLPTGDLIYTSSFPPAAGQIMLAGAAVLSQQGRPPTVAGLPSTAGGTTEFRSKIIAIVNWLSPERAGGPPR
jgi:hypothetical protein